MNDGEKADGEREGKRGQRERERERNSGRPGDRTRKKRMENG